MWGERCNNTLRTGWLKGGLHKRCYRSSSLRLSSKKLSSHLGRHRHSNEDGIFYLDELFKTKLPVLSGRFKEKMKEMFRHRRLAEWPNVTAAWLCNAPIIMILRVLRKSCFQMGYIFPAPKKTDYTMALMFLNW